MGTPSGYILTTSPPQQGPRPQPDPAETRSGRRPGAKQVAAGTAGVYGSHPELSRGDLSTWGTKDEEMEQAG